MDSDTNCLRGYLLSYFCKRKKLKKEVKVESGTATNVWQLKMYLVIVV